MKKDQMLYEKLFYYSQEDLSQLDLAAINQEIFDAGITKIHIARTYYWSFGRFIYDSVVLIRYLNENKKSDEVWFLSNWATSRYRANQNYENNYNRAWFDLINRYIVLLNDKKLLFLVKMLAAQNNGCLWKYENIMPGTAAHESFYSSDLKIKLSDYEEEKGLQLLELMGLKEGDKFVCFHCRDSAFSPKTVSQSYRDVDISSYNKALLWLVEKGYFCIRMGSVVKDKLTMSNERIIDYASSYRTDFGDVYLSAKCEFFLGCTSGMLLMSAVFGKPLALTNCLPIEHMDYFEHSLMILKMLYLKSVKRYMTFKEIRDSKNLLWGTDSKNYDLLGVQVVDNSEDEILQLVSEMVNRLTCQGEKDEENLSLKNKFREIFDLKSRHLNLTERDYFKKWPYTCEIGSKFIKKYESLLD
jgi:putative glycosyltransferase (TIGR04372 family)